MKTKLMTATILAVALSGAAFAQTNSPPSNSPPPSKSPPPAASSSSTSSTTNTAQQNASETGDWQGSKIIGLSVYNDQDEKIGSIKELMLNKEGKIDKVA